MLCNTEDDDENLTEEVIRNAKTSHTDTQRETEKANNQMENRPSHWKDMSYI